MHRAKEYQPKYPSLFWEITETDSRAFHLFGTMHVSSKLVFHLSDSFYTAMKNVDAVAWNSIPNSGNLKWPS
ncbi:MAG: TraB/GumN family protein [Chitinophagaceae bacterium]|nr:TraB/GumN family protein [Chitinophagaceae bacterium]